MHNPITLINKIAYECIKIDNHIALSTVRVVGEKESKYKVFDGKVVKYVDKWKILDKQNYDREKKECLN